MQSSPGSLRRAWNAALAAQVPLLALAIAALLFARVAEGYTSFVLATAALYVIVGVGLNILLGLSGQVSFGHVGFFAIGAYATGIATLAGYGFWVGLLSAAVLSGVIGAVLAVPALRVSGPYLAMLTIAFAFIVEHVTIEWRDVTGGANGLSVFSPPTIGSYTLAEQDLATLAVALAVAALMFFARLARGSWGMALRAVRDSEIAARSVGLNPLTVKSTSFLLSAVLTGIAGAVFVPLNGFISPGSFPFFQSILFILAVVVGGAGTVLGPVVGAALVVLLPEVLSSLAEYRLLMFGGLLLGVLWLAPRGVMGTIERLARSTAPPDGAPAPQTPSRSLRDLWPEHTEVLEVGGLVRSFGGVHAVRDVSFTAQPGHITSLIGPNGAGKTTVLNLIGGFYAPDAGSIRLGSEVAGRAAHEVARHGIARTYQTTQLFHELSVLDNVLVALRGARLRGLLAGGRRADEREQAETLLGFVGYTGSLERTGAELAHVDRRLVEMARALATRPGVLLLDEPAAGLGREDKQRLGVLLQQIAEAGIAVVLVEHDMALVMEVSDHIVVLDTGAVLTSGTPSEIGADARVRSAYLGATGFEGRGREHARDSDSARVLTVSGLTAGYGAAPVIEGIDLRVDAGEMVAVLGANGAGKSTLLRAISGLHRPVQGSVKMAGEEIGQRAPHAIIAAGVALVPEGRQVFPELTARENIELGAYSRAHSISAAELEALLERFPRLRERLDARAGVLSGGEQQMLAIARALVSDPRLLLLDEPTLGLAPAMIAELYELLASLRDAGITILIVDQMANLTLTVADRAYVLSDGAIAHSGSASELKGDTAIVRAYLGVTDP